MEVSYKCGGNRRATPLLNSVAAVRVEYHPMIEGELRDIVEPSELTRIEGVGTARIDKYGTDLLSVVEDFPAHNAADDYAE